MWTTKIFFLVVLVSFSLIQSSWGQPYCGEFDGVLAFDGSTPDQERFSELLQLVQGTARSFNWRGAEAARIGALQFSNVTREEQDVLYFTEQDWADFPETEQVRGPKDISQALMAASQFVATAPNPRRQYIILFVTNSETSAADALDVSNTIKQNGQRIITVFLQDQNRNPSTNLEALATSPQLHFVLSNDPSTYYSAVTRISQAVCTDLNGILSSQDQCPGTFKIQSGMCGCRTYDINGCSIPTCSLPSTFEDPAQGTDGWLIINTEGVVSNPSVELYEGGRRSFNSYLFAPELSAPVGEDELAVSRYFLAPKKYIGPQEQLFGGLITFSLRLGLGFQRLTRDPRERLIIEGSTTELLLWSLEPETEIRSDVWIHFGIPIVNTGDLKVRSKETGETRIALEDDVKGVLEFIRSIRVLVDFVDGYNSASFDNFKFCEISRINTFEESEEKYLVLDEMGPTTPSWQLNFISFEDRTADESNFPFYFVTPWASGVACEGSDLSDLNGGLVNYDLSLFAADSAFKTADDVIIVGQDKELIYRLRPEEFPSVNLTRIRVSVSEESGRWYVSPRTTDLMPNKPFPRTASVEDFEEVLSGVSFVYLRGEFLEEDDTTLLHNALTVSQTSVGCGGNPPCNDHGRCISAKCECFYGWTGSDCSQEADCSAGKFKLSNFAA